MKFVCLFSLVLCPLFAQPNAGAVIIDQGADIFPINFTAIVKYQGKTLTPVYTGLVLHSFFKYSFVITKNPDLSKSFMFKAAKCDFSEPPYPFPMKPPLCFPVAESDAIDIGPIAFALKEYHTLAPMAYHHPIMYSSFAELSHGELATVQPVTLADPQMVMLDGLSYNLVEFDMTNFAIISQVALPQQARVFSVRPDATGPGNEVWTAHGGTVDEISITDLASQSVVATIPTTSLDPNNTVPVGIGFTSTGLTALYAVSYFTPDSSGDNGALLVFDVVNRKLTSTLPLKYAPAALVVAPDGLTAYILSSTGMITYYDVFSGTADLSVSTYTPGMNGGYPGAVSSVFIHPNGNQLFWNVGTLLEVFDLTAHKLTNQFNSYLPTTATPFMQVSQDGLMAWFADEFGDIFAIDTRYGNLLAIYLGSSGSAVYPGPLN
jgi:hypothetical protein